MQVSLADAVERTILCVINGCYEGASYRYASSGSICIRALCICSILVDGGGRVPGILAPILTYCELPLIPECSRAMSADVFGHTLALISTRNPARNEPFSCLFNAGRA